jgi:hypothetical protein
VRKKRERGGQREKEGSDDRTNKRDTKAIMEWGKDKDTPTKGTYFQGVMHL